MDNRVDSSRAPRELELLQLLLVGEHERKSGQFEGRTPARNRATAADATHRVCTQDRSAFVCWHLDRALLVLDNAGGLFQKSGQFKGRTLRPGQGYRD